MKRKTLHLYSDNFTIDIQYFMITNYIVTKNLNNWYSEQKNILNINKFNNVTLDYVNDIINLSSKVNIIVRIIYNY